VRPNLPLLALVAAAAALALVAAYASVTSDRSYYAYGDITADKEAVDITVSRADFTLNGAGDQGKDTKLLFKVKNQSDIENVKIRVSWVNAKQVAKYFDYIRILLKGVDKNNNAQVKGYLDPEHTSTIITLDADDLGNANADGYHVEAVVYWEAKEGMMFQNLPLIFNVKLLQVS